MGGLAFVFSGQGDQFPGMGKNLFDTYKEAQSVFETCDRLRPNTSYQCFKGTAEELMETETTQPCLFAMEYAAAKTLMSKGIMPHRVAGFSLGEVVAATCAGLYDLDSGFELVCKRGILMQLAAGKHDTLMAAVLRLENKQVISLCESYSNVYPVNFNCPGQVSVSGSAEQMKDFLSDVKKAGGYAVPLKVKGAFHSPYMEEAEAAFREELKRFPTKQAKIPLYSDMTAKEYTEDVVSLLSQQISHPVKWEALIRNMITDGIDTFIEIGPGKTLTNMIRKIDGSVKTLSIEQSLAEVEKS